MYSFREGTAQYTNLPFHATCCTFTLYKRLEPRTLAKKPKKEKKILLRNQLQCCFLFSFTMQPPNTFKLTSESYTTMQLAASKYLVYRSSDIPGSHLSSFDEKRIDVLTLLCYYSPTTENSSQLCTAHLLFKPASELLIQPRQCGPTASVQPSENCRGALFLRTRRRKAKVITHSTHKTHSHYFDLLQKLLKICAIFLHFFSTTLL